MNLDEIQALKEENKKLKLWQFTHDDIKEKEKLKEEIAKLKRELRETNIILKTVLTAYNKIRNSKEVKTLDNIMESFNYSVPKTPKKTITVTTTVVEAIKKIKNINPKGFFKYA